MRGVSILEKLFVAAYSSVGYRIILPWKTSIQVMQILLSLLIGMKILSFYPLWTTMKWMKGYFWNKKGKSWIKGIEREQKCNRAISLGAWHKESKYNILYSWKNLPINVMDLTYAQFQLTIHCIISVKSDTIVNMMINLNVTMIEYENVISPLSFSTFNIYFQLFLTKWVCVCV